MGVFRSKTAARPVFLSHEFEYLLSRINPRGFDSNVTSDNFVGDVFLFGLDIFDSDVTSVVAMS